MDRSGTNTSRTPIERSSPAGRPADRGPAGADGSQIDPEPGRARRQDADGVLARHDDPVEIIDPPDRVVDRGERGRVGGQGDLDGGDGDRGEPPIDEGELDGRRVARRPGHGHARTARRPGADRGAFSQVVEHARHERGIRTGPSMATCVGRDEPVGPGVSRLERQPLVGDRPDRPEGRPTPATGRREEGPLGLDRSPRVGIVEPRDGRARRQIVGADLDGECALARSRRDDRCRDDDRDPVGSSQPAQARHGEHERVGLAVVEPAEPRVDVPVERVDPEVGARGPQERRPARAVGADAGTERHEIQALGTTIDGVPRRRPADHDGVFRRFADQVGGDRQARILIRRHVLGTVHGDIDAAVEQRRLDRADERALAPGRVRLTPVAIGHDRLQSRFGADRRQGVGHETGLDEGERAASGADPHAASRRSSSSAEQLIEGAPAATVRVPRETGQGLAEQSLGQVAGSGRRARGGPRDRARVAAGGRPPGRPLRWRSIRSARRSAADVRRAATASSQPASVRSTRASRRAR